MDADTHPIMCISPPMADGATATTPATPNCAPHGLHSASILPAADAVFSTSHPVGSRNSCGLSVIEFPAAAKALEGWDLTASTADPVDCRREAAARYQPRISLKIPLCQKRPILARNRAQRFARKSWSPKSLIPGSRESDVSMTLDL